MADFNNITGGLKIASQIPLDAKTISLLESNIKTLGIDNNLAYTYFDSLNIKCLDTKKTYEWREVQIGEENTGLLLTGDFTYPIGVISYGFNYSNKKYNFFERVFTGAIGATGPQGKGISTIIKTNTVGLIDTYTITYTDSTSLTYNVVNGSNGVDTTSNNLQKTITSSFILSNEDNNHTIIINNGSVAVNITIPTGLLSKIAVGFIQQGTGLVTFTTSSTTINSPSSYVKIKGQNFWAYVEQVSNTNIYQLTGVLKA